MADEERDEKSGGGASDAIIRAGKIAAAVSAIGGLIAAIVVGIVKIDRVVSTVERSEADIQAMSATQREHGDRLMRIEQKVDDVSHAVLADRGIPGRGTSGLASVASVPRLAPQLRMSPNVNTDAVESVALCNMDASTDYWRVSPLEPPHE